MNKLKSILPGFNSSGEGSSSNSSKNRRPQQHISAPVQFQTESEVRSFCREIYCQERGFIVAKKIIKDEHRPESSWAHQLTIHKKKSTAMRVKAHGGDSFGLVRVLGLSELKTERSGAESAVDSKAEIPKEFILPHRYKKTRRSTELEKRWEITPDNVALFQNLLSKANFELNNTAAYSELAEAFAMSDSENDENEAAKVPSIAEQLSKYPHCTSVAPEVYANHRVYIPTTKTKKENNNISLGASITKSLYYDFNEAKATARRKYKGDAALTRVYYSGARKNNEKKIKIISNLHESRIIPNPSSSAEMPNNVTNAFIHDLRAAQPEGEYAPQEVCKKLLYDNRSDSENDFAGAG